MTRLFSSASCRRRLRARRLGRAGPASAAALAALPLAVVPAGAGDQSITGSLRQTFVADTNTQLEQDGDESLGSITRLGVNYVNRTPSAELSLSTGLSFSAFTEDDDDNLNGLFPRLSGGYTVRRPTRTLSFSFSGSVRPVDFTANTGLDLDPFPDPPDDDPDDEEPDDEEPDDGETPDDGDFPDTVRDRRDETLRILLSAGFSYNEQLTSTASRSLGFSISRRDYLENDDDQLIPSTNLSANSGYTQQINSKASWSLTAGSSLFMGEGEENRTTLSMRLVPGFNYAVTPNERYSISLGPSLSVTHRDELVNPFTGERDGEIEVTPGVSGGASFSYTDRVNTVSASLTQGVSPDDEGVAVNRTGLNASYGRRVSASDRLSASLGLSYRTALGGDGESAFDDTLAYVARAGWSHEVNPRNSLGLNASARLFDDEDDDDETVFGVGATWSYRFLPDTRANLGYDFRWEQGEDSLTSHRLSLTLSHDFTLLP